MRVDGLYQVPSSVVPKVVRVNSRHVRAAAELGDDIFDATCGVRAAFAAEDRPARLAR